jgi:GTPase involved in cell partitioning and DNA repair
MKKMISKMHKFDDEVEKNMYVRLKKLDNKNKADHDHIEKRLNKNIDEAMKKVPNIAKEEAERACFTQFKKFGQDFEERAQMDDSKLTDKGS